MSIEAFRYPLFIPAMRIVTAITNAKPAEVTTSFPHGYITGLNNRLYIQPDFGMPEANLLTSYITVTSDTTFTMDQIDSTNFIAFVVPGTYTTPCQVVNVGEISETLKGAYRNQFPLMPSP